jgi:predicted PurR-regulated permease PerM
MTHTPPLSRRSWFWLLVFAALAVFIYYTRSALVPFVTAMLLAYLFNPVVDRMQRHRVPRWVGTWVVMLAFGLVFYLLIALSVPLVQAQLVKLVDNAPGYIATFNTHLQPLLARAQSYLPQEALQSLQASASEQSAALLQRAGRIAQKLLAGSFQALSVLSFMFLTPVLLFYFLRDWDRITATVKSLYPRYYYDQITEQMLAIDATLAGFLRGQLMVALVLGAFYAIALTVAGLDFGFLIGIISGFLTFIPYVGSLVGGLVSVGVALAQFGFDQWVSIAIVAGIYAVGQFLEGNVFSPKLVGSQVNLHPLWIMFSLFVGGALYGFLGVLLAVPLAAVIGVLVRFGLGHYRTSDFYRSPPPPDMTPEPSQKAPQKAQS